MFTLKVFACVGCEKYSTAWKTNTTLTAMSEKRESKMKSYRKKRWFEVPARRAFINITPQVEGCLQ